MNIKDSVAFVTGANRGLGLALVRELQQQGVKKIYAGVRDPASLAIEGVIPVQIDVTDGAQVAAAAAQCGDVSLLINNAGIAIPGSVFDPAAIEAGAAMYDANVLGIVRMAAAFAPVLARQGGGAMVNILSVASWVNGPGLSLYAASKSAAWGVTNGLRTSLAEQGTLVAGVHVGFIDTDLTKGIDLPKLDAKDVAAIIVAGITAGQIEIVVDEISRKVKDNLTAGIYLAPLQR
jgi:NAD(P)-dependent dehydrogenase (short-subunit alcohol dehydrogenase family)